MKANLSVLKNQFEKELNTNILNFWLNEAYDSSRKTFYGRIDNDMQKCAAAPLSAVFITRILWTFSASFRMYSRPEYKNMADEAFRIILENFWDSANGGIYWSVFSNGNVENNKKQFYAQAFFIYALTEHYLAFKDEKAKQLAISMFMLLEKYAFDKEFGGYFEANTVDWKKPNDQRLSEKDLDVEKSMNTHLHILEAYTNLYRIYKDPQLKKKLEELIRIFLDIIFDKDRAHLILFFDADWKIRSKTDSYGHNIETSWLLCEAAEVLNDAKILEEVEAVTMLISKCTAKEGIAKHGGLYYEKNENHLVNEFHWWPQAEAVIGFFNAYQVSGDIKYLDLAESAWNFIKKYISDSNSGEWFWGVDSDLNYLNEDKIGPWKAPYHNGRMCLEMIRRIQLTEL
jgi:mannobiose 2-epimerase